jgi:GT2 family glycosyltransferase
MTSPRTAVITIAHGRHEHLRRQQHALSVSNSRADDRIIVAMGDPRISEVVSLVSPIPTVINLDCGPNRLPLAAARNLGAAEALARGAEVLIFLDVDCIPDAELVGAYVVAAVSPATRNRILCGPVAYLPPLTALQYSQGRLDAFADPHPGRPAPSRGSVQLGGDHSLFWSLSFAVTSRVWSTIGGFCEEYDGYGAEDTDFGWTARRLGIDLAWVGSARAYHQHHPVSDPPIEHVDDIVLNAGRFYSRWQQWPMLDWLNEFQRMGLIDTDSAGYYRSRTHPQR